MLDKQKTTPASHNFFTDSMLFLMPKQQW